MMTTTTRTARPWGRGLLKASVAGLALALALTPAIAASPAWAANGTITITVPSGTQSTTQLTYKLYKVFDAYSSDAGVSYRLITDAITGTGSNGTTVTLVKAKTTVPDVAAVVNAKQSGSYDATTNPHFILDAAGNVHYGTEFTTEEAATNAKGDNTSIVTTQVTTVAATSSTPATVVYVNSAALTDDAIAAIKAYIGLGTDDADQPIETLDNVTTSTGTVSFNDVDDGYYYITTATGTAVTVTTNKPSVEVADKNVVPTIDKTITGITTGQETTGSIDTNGTNGSASATDGDKSDNAIAQVGSTVSYQVEILVGNGTKLIAFHDKMDNGLTLDKSGVTVQFYTGSAGSYSGAATENASSYYTVRADQNGTADVAQGVEGYDQNDDPDTNDTFTVDFKDDLFTLSSGGQSVSRILVTYSATVNSDALITDPLTNTTHVTYGDNHQSTTEDSTNVYNATITVDKQDGTGNKLAGAGFVLMNSAGKYYQAATTTTKTTTTTTKGTSVTWVDNLSDATELMSGSDGKLYDVTTVETTITENSTSTTTTTKSANTAGGERAFTGLRDGEYTLVESTTPRGYNTAANQTITISDAGTTSALTATNLSQSATVVNRTGAELPSTGGIGTTVLYAVGGVLVVGAGVALVTKRKMDRDR